MTRECGDVRFDSWSVDRRQVTFYSCCNDIMLSLQGPMVSMPTVVMQLLLVQFVFIPENVAVATFRSVRRGKLNPCLQVLENK